MWAWFRRLQPRTRVSLGLGLLGLLVLIAYFGSAMSSPRAAIEASQMQQGRAMGGAEVYAARQEAVPSLPPAKAVPRGGFEARPVSTTVYNSAWPTTPMLIRTASLRLQVKDVAAAYSRITSIADLAGGYIAASTLNTETNASGATVTVRLPNEGMDSAMEQFAALGKLLSRDVHAQEVTEEYVDLSSRRRNLQREELRLLDLLNRAGRVSDLLEVEQEVARVRGEIETISGRMNYLENRVAFSTIEVQLQGPRPKAPTGPGWAARQVVKDAWGSLRGTGRGLATVLIWVAMYLPIWLPLTGAVVWVARRGGERA